MATEEIVIYLASQGLHEVKEQFEDIVRDLETERETDIRQGRMPLPRTAIPGIALSRIEKTLVQ